MTTATIEEIALSMIPGLGCAGLRRLIKIAGSAHEVYNMPPTEVYALFGNRRNIAGSIVNKSTFARAEAETASCQKRGIRALFFTNPAYPQRLNRSECEDCPPLIYIIGECNLNAERIISIVGTRRATNYGRSQTERIVEELKDEGVTIVSGLAYGIDATSHSAAVERNMPTVAVLGHGLDQIYPVENTRLAHTMVERGGALLTEYTVGTALNARYFPARNRIIAALSDAVVVVEASDKGGALITANIANSYNRDVLAVPGRATDTYSKGCNALIANNKAIMARNADDILYALNWQRQSLPHTTQTELFNTLSPEEGAVVNLLKECDEATADLLAAKSGLSFARLSAMLIDLELKNILKCLPGKRYTLV
ncbi:MAG: DNA-processing protein DprA [Bacteroidales bacterium]|nr:DNA-processing protein DprA [Bacteroidales bacterium]